MDVSYKGNSRIYHVLKNKILKLPIVSVFFDCLSLHKEAMVYNMSYISKKALFKVLLGFSGVALIQ